MVEIRRRPSWRGTSSPRRIREPGHERPDPVHDGSRPHAGQPGAFGDPRHRPCCVSSGRPARGQSETRRGVRGGGRRPAVGRGAAGLGVSSLSTSRAPAGRWPGACGGHPDESTCCGCGVCRRTAADARGAAGGVLGSPPSPRDGACRPPRRRSADALVYPVEGLVTASFQLRTRRSRSAGSIFGSHRLSSCQFARRPSRSPETDRESRSIRRAERRGLGHHRPRRGGPTAFQHPVRVLDAVNAPTPECRWRN